MENHKFMIYIRLYIVYINLNIYDNISNNLKYKNEFFWYIKLFGITIKICDILSKV